MRTTAQWPNNSCVATRALVPERGLRSPGPDRDDDRDVPKRHGFAATAVSGAAGSALLAVASDLPGSPFGPRAGDVWPLARSGGARPWEGPALPAWAAPANSGPGVPTGHLLVLMAALVGAALLGVAWVRLWRAVRADGSLGFRDVWWVAAAWTAPLLFAAPFASQDVWVYAAQGRVVASGMSAATPLHALGHSVWLSGVDPKYLRGGSIYGPGANDLSALFARASGARPWIAVEGWRLAVIVSMVVCGWGVARIAAARGANPLEAVVAGVCNPAVLIAFVAGAHNDAVMIGLVMAGIALAVTGQRWWALGVLALAVTVKAPAALAVLAVAWSCWKGPWPRRVLAAAGGVAMTLLALAVAGLFSGGGFSWLKSASIGTVASAFSLARFAGTTSSGPANLVQTVGILVAVGLVLAVPRGRSWIGALAVGFGVMAVCSANPQPWYLLWAVPLVACTFVDGGVQRAALVVLTAMAVWSVLPFGALMWFGGLIALAVIGSRWVRSWVASETSARAQPTAVSEVGRR
jgi:alpha-1,6-mannosyltransferase